MEYDSKKPLDAMLHMDMVSEKMLIQRTSFVLTIAIIWMIDMGMDSTTDSTRKPPVCEELTGERMSVM